MGDSGAGAGGGVEVGGVGGLLLGPREGWLWDIWFVHGGRNRLGREGELSLGASALETQRHPS